MWTFLGSCSITFTLINFWLTRTVLKKIILIKQIKLPEGTIMTWFVFLKRVFCLGALLFTHVYFVKVPWEKIVGAQLRVRDSDCVR